MMGLAMIAMGLGWATVPQCLDRQTPSVEACLSRTAKAANAQMAKYLGAAHARLAREHRLKALAELKSAQASWTAYRTHECGAQLEFWSGGTIRTSRALTCRITLTRQHSHMLWQQWLTYPDSTPPILPDPTA